jgi:hypothetical protein
MSLWITKYFHFEAGVTMRNITCLLVNGVLTVNANFQGEDCELSDLVERMAA